MLLLFPLYILLPTLANNTVAFQSCFFHVCEASLGKHSKAEALAAANLDDFLDFPQFFSSI